MPFSFSIGSCINKWKKFLCCQLKQSPFWPVFWLNASVAITAKLKCEQALLTITLRMHVDFPISLKWSSTGVIWMFRTSLAGRSLTHFTLSFIFYKSFWGYWYLVWAISPHFCYVETSAKCSSIKFFRVHDLCHAHSLTNLQWSGPSDQWMLLSTEKCLQCQKWSP